jgi:hypothetical protein
MTETNNIASVSAFSVLDLLNVNKFTEKKGQFTYLSWAYAVREMLRVDDKATWHIHEYENENGTKQPYMNTSAGCFVKVTVHVQGTPRTQVHPVLNHKNQTIKEPNAFEINTSIQRCLAKAIALHGLGLYIYAGEDLPKIEPITTSQGEALLMVARKVNDEKFDEVYKAIQSNVVNQSNYKGSLAKLERIAKNAK